MSYTQHTEPQFRLKGFGRRVPTLAQAPPKGTQSAATWGAAAQQTTQQAPPNLNLSRQKPMELNLSQLFEASSSPRANTDESTVPSTPCDPKGDFKSFESPFHYSDQSTVAGGTPFGQVIDPESCAGNSPHGVVSPTFFPACNSPLQEMSPTYGYALLPLAPVPPMPVNGNGQFNMMAMFTMPPPQIPYTQTTTASSECQWQGMGAGETPQVGYFQTSRQVERQWQDMDKTCRAMDAGQEGALEEGGRQSQNLFPVEKRSLFSHFSTISTSTACDTEYAMKEPESPLEPSSWTLQEGLRAGPVKKDFEVEQKGALGGEEPLELGNSGTATPQALEGAESKTRQSRSSRRRQRAQLQKQQSIKSDVEQAIPEMPQDASDLSMTQAVVAEATSPEFPACLWKLAQTHSGSIEVQSMMAKASPEELEDIINALKGKIVAASTDQHANFVIQKAIEKLPGARLQWVLEELVDGTLETIVSRAKNKYGCRILQRLMEHCNEEQLLPIYKVLLAHAIPLLKHVFGHFVVEHTLENGPVWAKKAFAEVIVNNALQLAESRHGYALESFSRVFDYGDSEDGSRLAMKLLEKPNVLASMACTRFGPEAVKRVMAKATQADLWLSCRNLTEEALRDLESQLRRNRYGKEVVDELVNTLESFKRKAAQKLCDYGI